MKTSRYLLTILFLFFSFAFLSVTQSSCSRGYGCETQEYAKQDVNKKLEKTKRGKSNLFPKRMRKKMK